MRTDYSPVYPVPADAALGPVLLEIRFNGSTFYLPSYTNATWNIFSHIVLTVDIQKQLRLVRILASQAALLTIK